MSNGEIEVEGYSNITHETFINDATRAWNKAPISIKKIVNPYTLQKEH